MKKIHDVQHKLWAYIKEKNGDLSGLSLRDIGEEIGIGRKPQIIAHHLEQLKKNGLIFELPNKEKVFNFTETPVPETVSIPLFDCTAQCGPDGCLGEDDIKERVAVSTRTFGITDPKDYFLIEAKGKSMEPMIREGDLILARKQEMVSSGKYAVIVHNDMPKIKKVVINNNVPILVSLNESFSDEEVGEDDTNFRIVGLVKGIIRIPQ